MLLTVGPWFLGLSGLTRTNELEGEELNGREK